MIIEKQILSEVLLLKPKVFTDERGFFVETARQSFLEDAGIPPLKQQNQSRSEYGVLRGLHYQLESPQGKLVRVCRGLIFDVAVDIRKSSPNFGKWAGTKLSSENNEQIWIPEGFAHGFLTLTENTEVLYKSTNLYSPEDERCILWNDNSLAIKWPLSDQPLVSEKDEKGSLFKDADFFD